MERTGPRYALGFVDNNDNVPTERNFFPPLTDTITEVTSMSGWPFYSPRKKTININSVSVVHQEQIEQIQEAEEQNDEVDYLELLEQEKASKKKRVKHSKPKPKINYDQPEIPDGIEVDNLVDIPEEDLQEIIANSEKLSDEISDLILKEGAAAVLSFDSASTYAETALKDGLGVKASIDGSITEALTNIMRLSVISRYMERTSIPETYKKIYLANLSKLLAVQTDDRIRAKDASLRKSALLRAATLNGKVTTKDNVKQVSSLGVSQGASGKRVSKREKNDESQ